MRSSCAIALTLWCSAGCGLFGEGPGVGLDSPALTYEVTGRYRQRYGGNDEAFRPQVRARSWPDFDLPRSAVLSDGTLSPITYAEDATFSFLRSQPDELYRFPIPQRNREYQHTAAHLELGDYSPTRLEVVRVLDPTTLQVRLGAAVAGLPHVFTTGIWGQHRPDVPPGTGDFDIAWKEVHGLPPFGLLNETRNDRMYVTYVESMPGAQSYNVMTSVYEAGVTQTNGGIATFAPQQPMSFQRTECVRQQARLADAIARVRATLPLFPDVAAGYQISAAPIVDHLFPPNIRLAYDAAGGENANLDVLYGNPFPGTQTLVAITATASREVTLPGHSLPLTLAVSGSQNYQLSPASTCQVSMPVLDIGIASVPSLRGFPLAVDGDRLVIRETDRLDVTWQLASMGPVDYTNVRVYQVVSSPAGVKPGLRETLRVTTSGQAVSIPRELFQPIHYYVIGLETVRGVPGAANGDFESISYPTGRMLTWSSPFQVHW